jgi:ribonuclease E
VLPMVQPESIAPPPEQLPPEQPQRDRVSQEAARAPAEVETAQEAERAARRRSTVREKVSFLVDAQPAAAPASVAHSQPEPAASPAPAEPASETTTDTDTQPRRAGWWSRRFGNGE